MAFDIVLAPEAVADLRGLKANVRTAVLHALEIHLRDAPDRTGRSRIKRLRGLNRPQFRLRVGEVRIFDDVSGATVEMKLRPMSDTPGKRGPGRPRLTDERPSTSKCSAEARGGMMTSPRLNRNAIFPRSNASMITDSDVWRAAVVLIDSHGVDAELEAAELLARPSGPAH